MERTDGNLKENTETLLETNMFHHLKIGGWNITFSFQDGNFSGFMLNFGVCMATNGRSSMTLEKCWEGLTCYIVSVKESSCQSILFFLEIKQI